jgi:MOSC domain-containing protein YiiM
MKLASVNLGEKQTLQRRERIEQTGIFKIPVDSPIRVNRLGLEGDVIVSKKHHGGPDQAVYVYGLADYGWWSQELGKEISPGTFGENLTISELESAQFNIGDYLHVDGVTLQVSAPRIPCSTFAARMGDPLWVRKFRRAERPGLYCRVIQEGYIQKGDAVSVETYTGATISILEMFREYYNRDKSEELLRRHLNAPIAVRARRDLEDELQS